MAQSPNRILVVHCAAGVATSTPNSQSKPEPARRIVSAAQVEDDASFELKLRPKFLREFVGCETEDGKDCQYCGQKKE